MLVLTRKLGEKLIIGDDIVLTVVRIDNGRVRLGIEAPRDVAVHREEVHAAKGDCGSRQHGSDGLLSLASNGAFDGVRG